MSMLTTVWKRKALPCWPRKFYYLSLAFNCDRSGREREREGEKSYPADDLLVGGEMSLAVLAAVDLSPGEVGVV
jgi:hypothetical protein